MATLDKKIRRGLKIFLTLVILTMLALLIFSDPDPGRKFSLNIIQKISYAFKKMDPLYLVFALVFWGAYTFVDALRVSLFWRLNHYIQQVTRVRPLIPDNRK